MNENMNSVKAVLLSHFNFGSGDSMKSSSEEVKDVPTYKKKVGKLTVKISYMKKMLFDKEEVNQVYTGLDVEDDYSVQAKMINDFESNDDSLTSMQRNEEQFG